MKGEEMLLLENQLCFPLYAVSRLVTQLYTPLLDQLDITYPQYLVLLVLWEQDRRAVTDIGAQLLLETNTLTPLLKRMEHKELIQRTRDTDDERRVLIALTPRGRKLKQKALCIPQALIAGMQDSPLTAREMDTFRRTLHRMLGALKGNMELVTGG